MCLRKERIVLKNEILCHAKHKSSMEYGFLERGRRSG